MRPKDPYVQLEPPLPHLPLLILTFSRAIHGKPAIQIPFPSLVAVLLKAASIVPLETTCATAPGLDPGPEDLALFPRESRVHFKRVVVGLRNPVLECKGKIPGPVSHVVPQTAAETDGEKKPDAAMHKSATPDGLAQDADASGQDMPGKESHEQELLEEKPLANANEEIARLKQEIARKKQKMARRKRKLTMEIIRKDQEIAIKDQEIARKETQMIRKNRHFVREMDRKDQEIAQLREALAQANIEAP